MTSRPSPAAWAGRHLASPPLRALHRLGLAPRAFALLETTRLRTGRRLIGAEGVGERFTGPGGELIHAEIRIGDSVVMITGDAGDGSARSPSGWAGWSPV